MAYLNRDPGMCRFEPDPARGRNDLVSGQEAALRLLARQGRREPHCFRDLSYAKPPPESWRLADARDACDAVASELEREIAAETIRLAARRAPRRAAAAAVPAVPRTVMEDGKTIWGAWDWEGPAHDAANAAADDARHEALRHDWAATKAKDDDAYKESITERSNLYDALGWDDVSAARAASSEALERDMYRQNDAMIEGRRRARVRLRWAGAKAATRAIGRHAVAAANQFDVLAEKLDAELAAAEREAHAAATDVSSSRPAAPTEDAAFAALADGLGDDNGGPGETEQEEFEAIAAGLGDVDREIAEDERAIERLLSGDDEQEAFAALADGLGDVDEPPTEQAEFAALAAGLGDGGE
ncbi:unnamed protein product [Pelagomonas calceolata]|uniref:Uncharacterized protein n=1 Tax=Pelagomonas calceolata TaxID=35677 RepID=A0A8J2SBI1_9STRA|nr:unnamed protein product [Pelagomonas calceolata]